MHAIRSISFPLNDLNRIDHEVQSRETQVLGLNQRVTHLTNLSNTEKSTAKFRAVAILVIAVVLIAIGIGTAFVNPFCAFIILGGVALLATLILPKRQYEKGRELEVDAGALVPQIQALRNDIALLNEFKTDLSTPYLQTYVRNLGVESMSYDDYLLIPEQIRAFAKAYPTHIPKAYSDEIPLAFQNNPLLRQRICPITQLPIADPVKSERGILYERLAVLDWIKTHRGIPYTADCTYLLECPDLRRQIVDRLDTLHKLNRNVPRTLQPRSFREPPLDSKVWTDDELLEYTCPFSLDPPVEPLEDLSAKGLLLYSTDGLNNWITSERRSGRIATTLSTRLPLTYGNGQLIHERVRPRPDLHDRIQKLFPEPEPEPQPIIKIEPARPEPAREPEQARAGLFQRARNWLSRRFN